MSTCAAQQTAPRGVDFPNSAYPTKPTHQRSSIYHADRFFEDRRSPRSQFQGRREGAAEKGVSKVKEVAEDAKDAVKGAIEGVKNIVKKDDK